MKEIVMSKDLPRKFFRVEGNTGNAEFLIKPEGDFTIRVETFMFSGMPMANVRLEPVVYKTNPIYMYGKYEELECQT